MTFIDILMLQLIRYLLQRFKLCYSWTDNASFLKYPSLFKIKMKIKSRITTSTLIQIFKILDKNKRRPSKSSHFQYFWSLSIILSSLHILYTKIYWYTFAPIKYNYFLAFKQKHTFLVYWKLKKICHLQHLEKFLNL